MQFNTEDSLDVSYVKDSNNDNQIPNIVDREKYSPRQPYIPKQREKPTTKTKVKNEIIDQLAFSGELSQSQINLLKETLQNTLSKYNIDKDEAVEEKSYMVDNMRALEEFVETKRVENKSQSTLYSYNSEISRMFEVVDKHYSEITTADVRRYLDYRRQQSGLKAVTTNNIRMYLMSFFKWLVNEDMIAKNPIDRIGVVKAEKKIIDTLTDEEAEIIRCACDGERDLAIIDLLSSSGMRVSELCGLNKSDVDFDKGEVIVFGKGSKERVCFLTGRAKVHLKWYLEQRTDDNPALFVNTKKPYNRLSRNGVEFILKKIVSRSKVPRVRLYPHKYRSTLATNMINKGAPAEHIQHILGHQSVDTTISCYSRMDKNTVKQAHNTYIN